MKKIDDDNYNNKDFAADNPTTLSRRQ